MSRRERETRVRLEAMSEAQLKIVRDTVIRTLVSEAADLHLLHRHPDPKRSIREVTTLGRLAYWLQGDEIAVPDRRARVLMERIAEEVDDLHRDVYQGYEEAVAEHDALRAFLAYLTGEAGSAGR
jgi:hypothetical protein